MSSDFYFRKWKKTLVDLEDTVKYDTHLQETKAHDKKRCEAALRLSGVLGQYMSIYNDVWECLHQNLQVQKTSYMHDVLRAVVYRILELKHELRKLEKSEYQFSTNGLLFHKLTLDNAELNEMPEKIESRESIKSMLKDVFAKVKERRRLIEEEAARVSEESVVVDKWWENEDVDDEEDDSIESQQKVEISEEQLEFNRLVKLIQAQERARQVTADVRHQRQQRERWAKELAGLLAPPASYGIRERAATLIQKVFRAYFESKRQKIIQCKRDEILGLRLCSKPKLKNKENFKQVIETRNELKRKYDVEWKTKCERIKQDYLKKKVDEIREDYRDVIREWFKTWYISILFFHDIPTVKNGGASLILKEELPTPEEWLEEYKQYMADKKANKNKSAINKKMAKMEAKLEELARKKEETMKKKIEQEIKRKMMKNPTLHPGFHYPKSNKTEHILEIIKQYHRDWDELDKADTLDVKEKSVESVDKSNIYMEVKIEILSSVEEDMKQELKLLKKALKIDYANKEEKMPEPMKQKKGKKGKRKAKVKNMLSKNVSEALEDLVFRDFIKEYPYTKLEEFIGDPNFSGADMRCDYVKALPHHGEIRNIWWERCRDLMQGFQKILLVGPKGSGKTMLVHILASMNEAVLFELNPSMILETSVTEDYLDQLVRSVVTCAVAVQPSVIHFKHVHRLYYRKVPPEEATVDWKLIERHFVKRLSKKIHKTDKITIIGTCLDPWRTKTQKLLKQFPTVVLVPTASYGTVVQILSDWVLSHTVLPKDLEVSTLAYVLQGHSYGFLKNALEKFLSAETIVRIAARGLTPMDVYKFILEDGTDSATDYSNYLKWYSEKTALGVKEKKHLEEQLNFKQVLEDYKQRMEKKKKISAPTATPSEDSSA